ncbi:reverse transcriptase domain-containing protein [Tanacetum coccineum]
MVNNIPLVLNVWEPGIWLDKVEPSTIPVWACVYSLPMELCNGNGIGKVFSGIGKPMLMDKLTKERCLKKARKLDFARVLVEVFASDDLPDFLEIEYPKIGDRPARVGKLEVKYQWKPPLCTHCKTFGHATMSCKVRPRAEGEIAAKAIKDAMKFGDSVSIKSNDGKCDDDGFVTVGRKGKANVTQSNDKRFVMKNRNFYGNFRQNFGRQGPNQQNRFSNQKYQAVGVKYKSGGENIKSGSKGFDGGKSFGENEKGRVSSALGSSKKSDLVQKPLLSARYNENFKPKVLVRGSNSSFKEKVNVNENIPVTNSFQAFEDQDMVDKEEALNDIVNEEYDKIVWPQPKSDVDSVMKSGKYPSMEVRTRWSLSQLDYFFKNCSNYGMEPYIDEEEVESKNEGMVDVMKPEKLDENGPVSVNHGASNDSINDEC